MNNNFIIASRAYFLQKIISLEAPFTYEFDRMLCVSCMSYIITLTFGQSSIVEVDPLT